MVGLVGPNGAGKTTLLSLATGMLAPTTGTIEVLGGRPAAGPAQLARVGYLAQDAPVYAGLSVAEHLRLGARLNPGWDAELARSRVERLDLDAGQKAGTLSGGQRAQLALTLAVAKRPELLILDEPVASLDPRQHAGKLSGGQRAQLALTLAVAKRPELLILDEPIASLDPLARREFLQDLADVITTGQVSIVMSSHLVGDLERVCDYLIVLVGSQVRRSGQVSELLAAHRRVASRQASLEDLVLAAMSQPAEPGGEPTLEARQ